MKSIACVNSGIPTVDNYLYYLSSESLRDYDIAVFDPEFPYLERVQFSAGGSCLSIESGAALKQALSHWSTEISTALKAGKTIFVILSPLQEDQAAIGSTMGSRNTRTYSTAPINNYSAIPVKINPKNAQGRKTIVADHYYRSLFECIKDIIEYKVILQDDSSVRKIITARDGSNLGGIVSFAEAPGHLVALPYFNFDTPEFVEDDEDDKRRWNAEALKTSRALVKQLVAIDKHLKSAGELTPPPDWVVAIETPDSVAALDSNIVHINEEIASLEKRREEIQRERESLLEYTHLLYETGKPLENAIEKALILLGYEVGALRISDLEIDHVILSPSGMRMIGESEGKDNSAIDISKFRQLESNIGEDFERAEITEPAKGVLFGNGYRLTPLEQRAEQFTQKSLTNAKRLGSALIRTADLYPVALYLLNRSEDESYRIACRKAIEETVGSIVEFPTPPSNL